MPAALRDLAVVGRDVDAVRRAQLVEPLAARPDATICVGCDVAAAHEAADQRLGHVAGADEADRV